ncbi:MAG: hypothetical protein ACK40G_06920 [Cytophagaceae bacterium]
MKASQPWIHSKSLDGLFILFPPFAVLLLIIFLPEYFNDSAEVNPLSWFILILLIDVAHVYSTLYRTYFDPAVINKHKKLLYNIPLLSWIAGVVLYEIDAMLFWRVLAYIAVFHFIRQQYGFMKIYSRKENNSVLFRTTDIVTIYAATLYPIIYWHLNPGRNFQWFVKGDFIQFSNNLVSDVLHYIYFIVLGNYIVKEVYVSYKERKFNIPKNVLIAGTVLSWYIGIVYYNGDLIFTMLNVVSHGIPYMALIWIYGYKTHNKSEKVNRSGVNAYVFRRGGIILFVVIIILLAYIEEAFWDKLVWNSHPQIFGIINTTIQISSKNILAIVIPLLTVPQLTHYIIDGFIWKIKQDNFDWKEKTLGA